VVEPGRNVYRQRLARGSCADGGGGIISKAVRDKDVLPGQIMLLRTFVRAIFLGTEDEARH